FAVTSARNARDAADRQELAERRLYVSDMNRIRLVWEDREVGRVRALLDRQRPDRRGWEWHYWDRLDHTARRTFHHPDGVHALAVRPDGRRIATGGVGTIKLWDTDTGQELFTLTDQSREIGALAFSPDGHRLYSTGAD